MHVIGRDDGPGNHPDGPVTRLDRPTAHLGRYLARDGSAGAAVGLDLDDPHATLVVGKRGTGKSHTLGVLAEAAARTDGIAPVVCDPMGAFAGLAAVADGEPVPARVVAAPRVRADALPPGAWPDLLGLDPAGPVGALVWEAAASASALAGMSAHVDGADAERGVRRAAGNYLRRAAAWGVFDPEGLDAQGLCGDEATVLSLAGLDRAPASAVIAAVARACYTARVEETTDRLPWLFVDEAHVAFEGVAGPALRTLLTRGRAPGVSLALATQRPGALPAVAVSQADLLVAHRLTGEADLAALAAARPAAEELAANLPTGVGEALVVDDATGTTHTVRVRPRETPHGGHTPSVTGSRAMKADEQRSEAGRSIENDRCVGTNPRP